MSDSEIEPHPVVRPSVRVGRLVHGFDDPEHKAAVREIMREVREMEEALESLRNGIMQAHMKGAEHGDQVLMACMRAHHEAANQAIEKLGGEVVPLANLEALTHNTQRSHGESKQPYDN